MTDEKRSCLAYLYASKIRPTLSYRKVFDQNRGQYHYYRVSRRNGDNELLVFDFTRSNYLGGRFPNLYDYASSTYVNIRLNGTVAHIYDYESGFHARASIVGHTVTIYDFQTGVNYKYKLG